jgi:Uma2 family endonuclease
MGATLTTEPVAGGQPRLFSRDEYWEMVKLGFFHDQRTELIGGRIYVVPSQNNRHAAAVTLGYTVLANAFGSGFWVRVQMTHDLSPDSMPDPDLSVIAGDPRHPDPDLPTTALIVVEVSDTTLSNDRNRKASLYAAAGIQDYWIVNLRDQQLEVRRDPQPDATQEFGHGYASLTTLRAGDTVSPLALPSATIRIDDLLPQ